MARRYFKLIVEVDDTPEGHHDGSVTTPGVPTVTNIRKLGILGTLFHILVGKRNRVCTMRKDPIDVVIEIPHTVDAGQLVDVGSGCTVRCCGKVQTVLAENEHIQV